MLESIEAANVRGHMQMRESAGAQNGKERTGSEVVRVDPRVLSDRRPADGALEVHERLALLAVRVHLADALVARNCELRYVRCGYIQTSGFGLWT